MFHLILIIPFIALLIWWRIRYPAVKGKVSESLVNRRLEELPSEYQVFRDLTFLSSNGRSVQIDHLIVSPYGIFVIETKGYKGWILGSENAQYWTKSMYGNKYQFYNPILQNDGHVRFLAHFLRETGIANFIPIVVFNDSAELKVNVSEHEVINRCHLKTTILSYQHRVLTDKQCRDAAAMVHAAQTNNEGKNVQKQHKQYAQQRQYASRATEQSGRCPRCGADLVLRRGKYGPFYGCSHYPRCKYISNL